MRSTRDVLRDVAAGWRALHADTDIKLSSPVKRHASVAMISCKILCMASLNRSAVRYRYWVSKFEDFTGQYVCIQKTTV
jgi:hypothetical protein